jgi:hypothetical protein
VEGLGCGCKIVPLLQQRNVNLWETVKAGCIAMVQLQKIRLNDCTMHHTITTMGIMVCGHFVLSWIFMGQKTVIHSNKRYGIRAVYRGKVNIHWLSQHNTCTHPRATLERIDINKVVVPSPTSTPAEHSHT